MTDLPIVAVVCTDRGQHGRHELGRLRRTEAGVEQMTTRSGAAPWARGARVVLEGEEESSNLPSRIIQNAPDVTADYEGASRFRFHCPSCRRDVPWNLHTATTLVDGYLAAGRRVIDVSMLPMQ